MAMHELGSYPKGLRHGLYDIARQRNEVARFPRSCMTLLSGDWELWDITTPSIRHCMDTGMCVPVGLQIVVLHIPTAISSFVLIP